MDDELLDDLLDEVEELATQMPNEQLARLLEARAHALAPGTPRRAAWLCHAGERWEMEGDFVRAKVCYQEALRDGGETFLDPRADLANAMLELQEPARANELIDELRRDADNGELDELTHERVGEILEMHGRLEEALRWFDEGLALAQRDEPEALDLGCLNGHYRVRRALGLPLDRHDVLCEERRRDYSADVEDEKRLLHAGGSEGQESTPLTVLYWLDTELDRLLDRWPGLADVFGSDHFEHRLRVERRLRELVGGADRAGAVAVGLGDFEEYVLFAGGRGASAAESSTRAAYAAHLAYLGRVVPWPPGRDDPCWCGASHPYEKHCGALESAD
jgi:tetratricopeptide (TPR) repeat protein